MGTKKDMIHLSNQKLITGREPRLVLKQSLFSTKYREDQKRTRQCNLKVQHVFNEHHARKISIKEQ